MILYAKRVFTHIGHIPRTRVYVHIRVHIDR